LKISGPIILLPHSKFIIENRTDCPRYTGINIADVTISESPEWLKKQVESDWTESDK